MTALLVLLALAFAAIVCWGDSWHQIEHDITDLMERDR